MRYIGIDPGKSGAMSIIYEDGSTKSIPFNESDYIYYLSQAKEHECFCALEKVNSMPHQGVTSTFTFGTNYGWIMGVLEAYGIPFQLIRPQTWKKAFGVTADKNTSIRVAKRLFPKAVMLRTERSRKDDNNIAESLLLACYAKRIYGKE